MRSNEAGSVSGSAFVTVLVRTQIVQPPVDTKVILGHVANLNCRCVRGREGNDEKFNYS